MSSAMSNAASGASLKISDITECSICLETFKVPKVLPCIHTFCLQCLNTYCEGKEPDEMACPLCRKVFIVPAGGVTNLTTNFFLYQLMQVNSNSSIISTGAPASTTQTPCEQCSDSNVEVASAFYCIECDQHICERCSVMHKKQKLSKLHQVTQNVDIPISGGRIKSAGNYCDQHPSEENRLYCYDCKNIVCPMCVSKHNLHKLSDVSESTKEFIEQIGDDTDKVTEYATKKQDELKQLAADKENLIEKVASAEGNISQTYDDLISLIQAHRSQLMKELNEFKEKLLKQIEHKKEEVERQWVIMESFKAYCQEIINKGTACDISRMAQDLHAQAEELRMIQDEPGCNGVSGVDVTFKPSLSTTDSVENFIGELTFTGVKILVEGESSLNARSFLDSPRLLGVIPEVGHIRGLTVLNGQMYVVRYESTQVNVYDTNNLILTHHITNTDSSSLWAIVASQRYNCLYISDTVRNVVYRYNLSDNIISSWPVGGPCEGLSLTSIQNVLATLWKTKQIQEYTPDGSLMREISCDSSVVSPRHSVQLSSDQFVVCHGGDLLHQVRIVDTSGRIIQSYGGSEGSGVGQLTVPTNLAVDRDGNVLVADLYNNRVVLLSPSLTHLGYITINGHTLDRPRALHLDQLANRLYIGENYTGQVFVLTA